MKVTKSLILLAVLAGFMVPLAACEHTVAEHDRTTQSWDGTVHNEQTTVKHNDVTGTTTVEQNKSQN